jgi:putative pyruvate formate lyase activating enzyme
MNRLKYNEYVYQDCTLCPRNCHADRISGSGFCGVGAGLKVAKAMLHQWEEPCIAGTHGSGAIFFSGCTLRCIYCQNHDISHKCFGKEISTERLKEIIFELQNQGAETIEFVTASQYIPTLAAVLGEIKKDIAVPTVFNCGGYESARSLRMLDGLIDIYLPDVKYYSDELAVRYSSAPHYYETALSAVREMIRQVGEPCYAAPKQNLTHESERAEDRSVAGQDRENEDIGIAAQAGRNKAFENAESMTNDASVRCDTPDKSPKADEVNGNAAAGSILRSGVIIRHLVLPNCRQDSISLLKGLASELGRNNFLISLMSQYTPFYKAKEIKELNRRVTSFEYDSVLQCAVELGLDGFMQERSSAKEEYTPDFDLSGV